MGGEFLSFPWANPFPYSADMRYTNTVAEHIACLRFGTTSDGGCMDILNIAAQSQALNTEMTQQAINIGMQKKALETEAAMVSKLMESASVVTQQLSQNALAKEGVGTKLNIVT